MSKLFLLFLAVPMVEMYLLIEVGGVIGALPTIALVVLTAVLGAMLVRAQGISAMFEAQRQLARGESPALLMVEGVALFLAGALLLTPGFFTDALGFALLTPPLRRRMVGALLARAGRGRGFARGHGFGRGHGASRGRVIDVEADRDSSR